MGGDEGEGREGEGRGGGEERDWQIIHRHFAGRSI